MTNQTNLDWMARNVHEWPAGDHQPWCYIYQKDGERKVSGNRITVIQPCVKIDRGDWLSRRAELQNKPSWADAPEWATHLAQQLGGDWMWCDGEPTAAEDGGWFGCFSRAASGEVLGDWRDTLERRPESTKQQEQGMARQEEKQQDNSWFERGELPPVGTECEFIRTGDVDWHKNLQTGSLVKVLAHYSPCDDGGKVAVFSFDASTGDERGCEVEQAVSFCFRALRTEREKAIEEMKQQCPYQGSWDTVGRVYAEALYDAGYRKDPK